MGRLNTFLLQYHYSLLFAVVLAEQLGAPIPAVPVLLAAGALTASGRISFAGGILVALIASLISDAVWYALGRRRGHAILHVLCRIALEPDSCVSMTKSWFRRLGRSALLIAKFIPGLSTAAPPMAGATGMPVWTFLTLDAAGSVLWAAAWMIGGMIFARQLEQVAQWATAVGARAALVATVGVGGYIIFKYVQRKRFMQSLRIARITPEDLMDRMNSPNPPFIVDLRNPIELGADAVRIPGAMWFLREELQQRKDQIPLDRDVILYCS